MIPTHSAELDDDPAIIRSAARYPKQRVYHNIHADKQPQSSREAWPSVDPCPRPSPIAITVSPSPSQAVAVNTAKPCSRCKRHLNLNFTPTPPLSPELRFSQPLLNPLHPPLTTLGKLANPTLERLFHLHAPRGSLTPPPRNLRLQV